MTDIPGTGKLSSKRTFQGEKPLTTQQLISVINVKQIKDEKKYKGKPEDSYWYYQLKYWLLFGATASLIFAVLALFHKQFIFLIPVSPLIAGLAWWIRKLLRRYNLEENDKLYE
jgi:hypothetical protein